MNNQDSFCILPFIHLQLRNGGVFAPCCHAADPLEDEEGNLLELGKVNAQDVFNSPQMREIRSSMIKGERPKACRLCFDNEDTGLESYRKSSNKKWIDGEGIDSKDVDELINHCYSNNFELEYRPKYIHLNLSNLCNLKCRMCWAGNSSSIEYDLVHNRWAPVNSRWTSSASYNSNLSEKKDYFSNNFDSIINLLGNDLNDLREIYFTGGEPLIMPSVLDCLRFLIDNDVAKNIRITMNTNATTIKPSVLDILKQFRFLKLNLSLDGTGAVYEYIRYPAKWKQVEANIKHLKQEFDLFQSVEISAAPILQIYNVFNIAKLYEFCQSIGISCNPQFLREPTHIAVTILPEAIRNEAARTLEKMSYLPKISSYLRQASSTQTVELVKKFMLFTNDLDKARGQNFRAIYEDMVRSLEENGFPWLNETLYA